MKGIYNMLPQPPQKVNMPLTKEEKIQKILNATENADLALQDELIQSNETLGEIKDTQETVLNVLTDIRDKEDTETDLQPIIGALQDVSSRINAIVPAIKDIKGVDLSKIEKVLKDIAGKETDKIDLQPLVDVLGNVLFAVQTTASHSGDGMGHHAEMIKEIKSVSAILNLLNENIATIDIPGIDYEKLARIIKENVKINVSGGGGPANVRATIQNGGVDINAATAENQAAIIAAISTNGVLSTVNSTTTPLGISATFTGTAEDTTNHTAASVAIAVDRSGTLNVDFSPDGTNWDQTQSYAITVTTGGVAQGFFYQFMSEAKYFRLRYVNGATAQAVFRLQTIFKKYPGTSEVQAVNVPLLSNTDALVTKGVIYGLTTGGGGGYVAVKVTPSGAITVGKSGLSGASANGQRVLTSADTWYSVPSTVPTSPYELTATIETGVGTIRRAFSNTGTPSTTNGEQATFSVTVALDANQVIYFGSSSASDSINWSTKII